MLPIPVIGVIEPGSRTIMTTKNQNVLILGTEGTIKSEARIDIILSTLIQTSMFMV